MKKQFSNFFLLFTIVLFLHSCGSKNEEGKMIPSTATYVSVVNTESIGKHLTWEEVKTSGWYHFIKTNESLPEWTKKVLNSPEESGINFNKSLIFFTNLSMAGKTYTAITGTLNNQKDFDQFNKEFSNLGEIRKQGKIQMLSLSGNQLLGWNENNFVYLSSTHIAVPMPVNPEEMDSTTMTSEEMMAECLNIFELKKENSLSKNEIFSNLIKENAEIRFYINGEELMKNNPVTGIGSMLNTDVFFKNNVTTLAIKFEDGEIDIHHRQYMSDKLLDFMEKNTGSKVHKDFIKNIPSDDIMGVISLSMKPGAIQNLIKLTGADGLANMFLQQAGFNLDDVSKATDGNWLMVMSDARTTKTSSGNSVDSNKVKFDFNALLAIGVQDKASFQKVVNGAEMFFGKEKMIEDFPITLNDQMMIISNSVPFASQFANGQSKTKFEFPDTFFDAPMGAYFDFQKMLLLGKESSKLKPEEAEFIDENLKVWKNIVISGGEVKKEAVDIRAKVHLMDQNIHSLKTLNSYLYQMAELQKKTKSTTSSGLNMDSLLAPPATDTVRITDTPKQQ